MDSQNGTSPHIETNLHFGYADYAIFGALLALSTLIGVYYGFFSKRKQNNTTEYLLGGKTMHSIPISASLIASYISGITLLGVPTEVYANGTQYWVFIIPSFLTAFSLIYVFLPVFKDTNVNSAFEYLSKRFDNRIRILASCLFTLSAVLYIGIVTYIPALALGQVTGLNIHVITVVLSIICIFYTTIGGLRAVVWTDTLQFVLMLGAIFALIYKGIEAVGSFCNAWQISDEGGRLIFFNMDPSIFVRSSFWTVCFGVTAMSISNMGVSQSCVQRFLAVPDLKAAKKSVWIFTGGVILLITCSCIQGVLMYAKYHDCDPVSLGLVEKLDQILPYYVMDVGGSITGLPGLFIAGIFSASLSSMSSFLNTLSGSIFEDFIRPRFKEISEKRASNYMKAIVVILGVIVLGLVFIIEKMGAIFYLAISLNGITAGSMLGIYVAGIFFRRMNSKGVFVGALASIISVLSILIGSHIVMKQKQINLPVRVDGCPEELLTNYTSTPSPLIEIEEPEYIFPLFKISFMYYTLIGALILLIVAYPVSYFTQDEKQSKDFDEAMLAPFLRSKEYKRTQCEKEYMAVELRKQEIELEIIKDGNLKS